jgi:hypothetical protein
MLQMPLTDSYSIAKAADNVGQVRGGAAVQGVEQLVVHDGVMQGAADEHARHALHMELQQLSELGEKVWWYCRMGWRPDSFRLRVPPYWFLPIITANFATRDPPIKERASLCHCGTKQNTVTFLLTSAAQNLQLSRA